VLSSHLPCLFHQPIETHPGIIHQHINMAPERDRFSQDAFQLLKPIVEVELQETDMLVLGKDGLDLGERAGRSDDFIAPREDLGDEVFAKARGCACCFCAPCGIIATEVI
jgi:hypothetical protein